MKKVHILTQHVFEIFLSTGTNATVPCNLKLLFNSKKESTNHSPTILILNSMTFQQNQQGQSNSTSTDQCSTSIYTVLRLFELEESALKLDVMDSVTVHKK